MPVLLKPSAGRRRQGHAAGAGRRRAGRRDRRRPPRGPRLLRRRHAAGGAVGRPAAAHRDPGPGRRPRERGAPRRARVLTAAPAPEDHRGGAVRPAGRGHARGHGRGGGPGGPLLRVRGRGHGGVHRPRRRPVVVLLHGDEHPPPGGASGDRAGHRPRPGGVAAAGGGGRAAAVRAGRHHGSPGTRSRPGSAPRDPATAGSCPPAARSCGCTNPRATASAPTPGSARAPRSAACTTRCCPRSSRTGPTGRPRSGAAGGPRGDGHAGRADQRRVPAPAAGPSGGRGGRVGHGAGGAGGGRAGTRPRYRQEVYAAAALLRQAALAQAGGTGWADPFARHGRLAAGRRAGLDARTTCGCRATSRSPSACAAHRTAAPSSCPDGADEPAPGAAGVPPRPGRSPVHPPARRRRPHLRRHCRTAPGWAATATPGRCATTTRSPRPSPAPGTRAPTRSPRPCPARSPS